MRKKSKGHLKERKVNMNKDEITNVTATLVKQMQRERTVGVQRDGGGGMEEERNYWHRRLS